MNQIDLKDRRAVITGAGRGMGLAIARRLLDSGARVSLWDINATLLESACRELDGGDRVDTQAADVSDYESVAAAGASAAAAMGGIDILINSAGIAGVNEAVADYPLDTWRQVQSVNLDGVFHTCRATLPQLQASKAGRVVNIASMAGKDGNPNASAYSVSKAGVIALTKSLGKELATTNVRVNAVAPAVIKTEMLADVTEEQIGYMLAKIPMGRMGTVEEIAALVAWLSSDECSYSTGAVFDLSGGRATY